MPTYEYACSKCGHEFEQFQSIKDEPLKKCPNCRKNSARRKIGGGGGLLFKGSGFYITDYRSDGYKKSAKAESGSSASAPAKAETKPAATTASK
jgi:putative FmdB family regulatory protein